MKSWIWKFLGMAGLLAMLSSCEKEKDSTTEETFQQGPDLANVPEGSFRVCFSTGNTDSRLKGTVSGPTDQIQTLRFLLYRYDGSSYVLYLDSLIYKPVDYQQPEMHSWPQPSFTRQLPNGYYRAVFVGNADPQLFETEDGVPQVEEVLTDVYRSDKARFRMPEAGPSAFHETNMYYLAVQDFDFTYTQVDILLQRLVSYSAYQRDFVELDHAISTLVDSVAGQIRRTQLTSDIVSGLLDESLGGTLGKILDGVGVPITGPSLGDLLGGTTYVVDRILSAVVGNLIIRLNDMVVSHLLQAVEHTLLGAAETEDPDVAAGLFNPWMGANYISMSARMASSVGFDREAKSYQDINTYRLPVNPVGETKNKMVKTYTLNGDMTVEKLIINRSDMIVGSVLAGLDDAVLDGLLVNIETPLTYGAECNMGYTTVYQFLRLALKDTATQEDNRITLQTALKGILSTEELTQALLGDNLLTDVISGLLGLVVDPLLNAITNSTVKAIDIVLPNLGIENMKVDGRWDRTFNTLQQEVPHMDGGEKKEG